MAVEYKLVLSVLLNPTVLPYQIEAIVRDHYLEILVTGERDASKIVEKGLEAANRISQLMANYDGHALLLRWELKGTLIKSQALPVVANLDSLPWDPLSKCALIPSKQDLDDKRKSFFQKMFEQTYLNIEAFDNEAEAIDWLIKSD